VFVNVTVRSMLARTLRSNKGDSTSGSSSISVQWPGIGAVSKSGLRGVRGISAVE